VVHLDLPDRFMTFDHERHTRRAIELAHESRDRGDDAYGSVLVRDNTIVAEARNAVVTDNDIRAHPELELARRAVQEFTPEQRLETILYTSTEPCPMCAGGLYHARIPTVVYSVSSSRAGELGTDLVVPSSDVFAGGSRAMTVAGPVCPTEGEQLHK